MGGFYACSGAETKHITTVSQYNEGTQLSHLDANTKVVTLTIGGNDIGFTAFGQACYLSTGTCAIGSVAYNDTLNKINNELPGKLSATYQAILNAAPNAQIYVLGYPHVAPVKTGSELGDNRCPYLHNSGTSAPWADAQSARDIVSRLNDKIETKVNDVRAMNAGNTRLHFVNVNGNDSPFKGHEVCSTGDSFFQNIDQAAFDPAYVFHPNQHGQEAYAQLVAQALS
jgi:hypothetical protein